MSSAEEFFLSSLCSARAKELMAKKITEMVRFAAEPTTDGELTKTAIYRASDELRLDFGTVKRAWYGIGGAEIYTVIYNAWAELVERRYAELRRREQSPWRIPHEIIIEPSYQPATLPVANKRRA